MGSLRTTGAWGFRLHLVLSDLFGFGFQVAGFRLLGFAAYAYAVGLRLYGSNYTGSVYASLQGKVDGSKFEAVWVRKTSRPSILQRLCSDTPLKVCLAGLFKPPKP